MIIIIMHFIWWRLSGHPKSPYKRISGIKVAVGSVFMEEVVEVSGGYC